MAATNFATLSSRSLFIYLLISLSSLLLPLHAAATSKQPTGFSSNIIHKNSVTSPFYNPNLTRSDRIRAAVRRSLARQQYFQTALSNTDFPSGFSALARPDDFEYVMEYYISAQTTPIPIRSYGIIDTSSGLLWLQCLPCTGCQEQKIPLFDPSKSKSYAPLTCQDDYCKQVHNSKCSELDLCEYDTSYRDRSYTKGSVARETLQFVVRKTATFISWNNVIMGCGHENYIDTDRTLVTPGVIGLDRSATSLGQQSPLKKFVHCFPNQDEPAPADGYIKFGDEALLSGSHTAILSPPSMLNTYYYLNLEGLSVDGSRLPLPNDTFILKGITDGLMIDSYTPYSSLKAEAFDVLVDALDKKLQKKHFVDGNLFEVCYQGSASEFFNGPQITYHFTGVDLKLPTRSIWVIGDEKQGFYCLGMFSTRGISIFGNYQQQNLQVGYDLQNNLVYFDPNPSCNSLRP
ncbi:hypothetical protein IFM89_022700 [Coptis chinensis]|uniref:Peptidase A1 domain-containing protein n=1 Tax=Coptis chinensis TaxID=261450 RepID=A0A835HPA7_9MAGN|nr:hypothetical protein IFM89_022700 [Coptis chinensis]